MYARTWPQRFWFRKPLKIFILLNVRAFDQSIRQYLTHCVLQLPQMKPYRPRHVGASPTCWPRAGVSAPMATMATTTAAASAVVRQRARVVVVVGFCMLLMVSTELPITRYARIDVRWEYNGKSHPTCRGFYTRRTIACVDDDAAHRSLHVPGINLFTTRRDRRTNTCRVDR